jgi:hypothetical protein
MPENPYQPPTVPDPLQENEPSDEMPILADNQKAGRVMFGVAVRTIGLLLIIFGLRWGFNGFLVGAGIVDVNYPPHEYAIFGVASFVMGAVLFFGAPVVVRLAYQDKRDADADG